MPAAEPLTPAQCRAARALLRWSIDRLAEASGLGINTISRFEQGKVRPTLSNRRRLRETLEAGGLIFLSDEGAAGGVGVRLRPGVPAA